MINWFVCEQNEFIKQEAERRNEKIVYRGICINSFKQSEMNTANNANEQVAKRFVNLHSVNELKWRGNKANEQQENKIKKKLIKMFHQFKKENL